MAEHDTNSATADTGPTLVDLVGEFYGDYSSSGSASEPSTEDTPSSSSNDTPVAPVEATPTDEATPGDASATPADQAPAPTAASDPEDPNDLTTDASDPLEGSLPATYKVNGQERTLDGVTLLKDGGAIVEPEHVQHLLRIASERDNLYERSQQTYQASQTLESQLKAATAWQVTGADGKAQTVSGLDGLIAQRLFANTHFNASLAYEAALKNPAVLMSLLVMDADGNIRTDAVNQDAWDRIKFEADRRAFHGERQIRERLPHVFGRPAQLPGVPGTTGPQETPATATFQVTQDSAASTVDQLVQDFKLPAFSKEDRDFLATELPRYVRPTTPQEKALGHPEHIVDFAFAQLVQRMAQGQQKATQVASTASLAAQRNASRLAAATAGKPQKAQTRTPQPPVQPKSRDEEVEDAYLRAERAAARAMQPN